MPHGKRIAELLLDIGALKISLSPPFTLTSGLKSPIYCDNRMVYSHPDARKFIVDALVQRVSMLPVEPDVIAGTATAAIGWAALVADRLHLPFVYVRSKAKEHGAKKRIEGDLQGDKDVVVIEDMFSTGGSAMSTVDAIRSEGQCRVHDVAAIYTHEFPSSLDNAQRHNITLHPLSTLTTLLEVAVEQGILAQEEIAIVSRFAQDPEHWSL